MKAVRVHKFGGLEALDYEEIPPTRACDGTGLEKSKGDRGGALRRLGESRKERSFSAVAPDSRV